MVNGGANAGNDLLAHEIGHQLGLSHTFGSCTNGTCGRGTSTADTYVPDCNQGWEPCGPDVSWVSSSDCVVVGAGISNNIMGYNRCRNYLSPLQMDYVYRITSNFTQYRQPFVLCTPSVFNPTIHITQSAIWESGKVVNADLVVESGSILDIRCNVYMSPHAKIIVKPGGKLIIDGGKITARSGACNTFWPGIQAWGTSDQHQEPVNNPTYQGLVVLKNGGMVEHARTGFINWNPDDWNSLGGVLQVQGTLNDVGGIFHNCWRGAEFMKYSNFYPTSPSHMTKNDNSYFRHAKFIVDDNYRGEDVFDAHVRMWEVKGISFQQCDFINAMASAPPNIKPSHSLGRGIYSYDATYSVTGQCAESLPICEYGSGQPEPVCPDASLRPSRFIGLDHGIRAGSGGIGGYTFTVKDSYFENNVCGIFDEAVDNSAILRNKFIVGGREVELTEEDDNFDEVHRAVFITQANGFRVEQNELSKATTAYVPTEGVVVGETGAYNDQVYKNRSNDMDYGFVAEGKCVDAANPTITGLSLLCNQNMQNVEEDFRVRTNASSPYSSHSIKMFQGSITKSAGNTFTPQQNGSSEFFNYHNSVQTTTIAYFWELPPGDLNGGGYNAPWVLRNKLSSPHNSCPTRITCGGGIVHMRALLTPLIQQERLAYLNLRYVFESLLDGGDFDELKETIMESWPQDAWELRNELMNKSPYLSTDILKEAGKKNILPNAMYLEVCLANPEATQRDGFVKWVQYEAPNPLPEYMVVQIVASWDQKTWRTSLEADMGWHNGEYQRLNDQLIGTMLTDTLHQPADSIRLSWQLNPSLRARYGEVCLLLEQDRFGDAISLLEGLSADYPLEKQGQQDRDDLLDLIAVIRPVLESQERTIMQLEPNELVALEGIASRQPSLGASYARNTLCYGYGICNPPVTGGKSQPQMRWVAMPGTEATIRPALIVHPNPASTWVAFSHELNGKVDRGLIRVRDAQGKVVYESAVTSSPGQLIWDTRGSASGAYSVELYNGGKLVDAQRVVIQP